jgi:hypothetical protein
MGAKLVTSLPPLTPAGIAMIPASLTLGDTWTFSLILADFAPLSGRSVRCHFAGPTPFTIEATADGSEWSFRREHDAEDPPTPGNYAAVVRSTNENGDISTQYTQYVEIRPDPAAAVATDARTGAQKMLAAVETALESLLAGTKASVSIGDQSYTQADAEKLMNLRDRLRNEVSRLTGKSRKILVHMP